MQIDLIIENASVFNSFLKTFERKNIAIAGEKFYYISAEDLQSLQPKETVDASGQYVIPGLMRHPYAHRKFHDSPFPFLRGSAVLWCHHRCC